MEEDLKMDQTEKNEQDIQKETVSCEEEVNNEESADADENTETQSDEKKEKSFIGKKKLNAEIDKLKKQIESLEKENSETKEKYARLAAEYDNYRKRTSREIEMKYSDAKADVWKNMISVVDDFERVLKTEIPEACQNYKEGIDLIYKRLTEMMTAAGIEEIKALNEQFNPELHNAVMHIESDEAGENEVVEVFIKGYKLGDKVIRCSMVKVAN